MEIRNMTQSDYSSVASIYQEGIDTGFATFETTVPSWDFWNQSHLPIGRLIASEGDSILAWAALSAASKRQVYSGVAEVSVYVSDNARGQGIGKSILTALIQSSEQNQIWTLQAGIFRENKSSISLHEKCGFRIIGYREKVAKLRNEWKDNIILERRSKLVGL